MIKGSFGLEGVELFLKEHSIPYKQDFHLKYELYFKRGGLAKLYILPSTLTQLVELIEFLRGNCVSYKIIGMSSNLLFLDELEYGAIISTKSLTGLSFQGDSFEVECGYSLQEFVRAALIHGRGGLEGLEGVPGSLGGALFMNAGAYGFSISDHVLSVRAILSDGKLVNLNKDECNFKFRSSVFKENPDYIILSATFDLPVVDRRDSAESIEVYHIARHSYQEFAYPNLGSMFSVKNDFYRELQGSKAYTVLCVILKLIFKNPAAKFIARKRPENIVFNKLARRLLGGVSGYVPSVKSMNILINDGCASTEDILEYMGAIRDLLPSETQLENEIVLSPANLNSIRAKKLIENMKNRRLVNEDSVTDHSLGK